MKSPFYFCLCISYAWAFVPARVARKAGLARKSLEEIPFSSTHCYHSQVSYNSKISALPNTLDVPSQLKDVLSEFMTVSSSPEVQLGDVSASFPSLDDFLGFSDAGPAVAVAVAVLIAGIAATSVSGKDTEADPSRDVKTKPATAAKPEPEPKIDVSIPYDAAAALAYKALKGTNEIKDMEEFAKFKTSYETYTVAEVILKKATREFESVKATLTKANE